MAKQINQIRKGVWHFNKNQGGETVADITVTLPENMTEKQLAELFVEKGILGKSACAVAARSKVPDGTHTFSLDELIEKITAKSTENAVDNERIRVALEIARAQAQQGISAEQARAMVALSKAPESVIDRIMKEYKPANKNKK